jgi:hypothetical protein
MNTELLETALRLAACGQLAIAWIGLMIHRWLDWREAIAQMPRLIREVFFVHTWFVALTCAIFGVLTWRFAPELAAGDAELGRWLCGAVSVFWGFRSVLQWTYYSSSHWRGRPGLTAIHWTLFLGYAAWSITYLTAAMRWPHPPTPS